MHVMSRRCFSKTYHLVAYGSPGNKDPKLCRHKSKKSISKSLENILNKLEEPWNISKSSALLKSNCFQCWPRQLPNQTILFHSETRTPRKVRDEQREQIRPTYLWRAPSDMHINCFTGLHWNPKREWGKRLRPINVETTLDWKFETEPRGPFYHSRYSGLRLKLSV